MLQKLAIKLSIAVIAILSPVDAALRTSPNPGSQSSDNTIADTEIYDCLQKGNQICNHRVLTTSYYCVTSGSDSKLSDSDYICTDKYTDAIFKYSMFSQSQYGSCPENQVGEASGATGHLEFPNGKQACSVVITAKCGGPSFRLNTTLSVEASDYEIYWTEWDTAMVGTPTNYLDVISSASSITTDMAMTVRYPPFSQDFDYTGLGTDYIAGYPGNDGICTNYWSFNCYLEAPDTVEDFTRLRALDYGLGKPATGYYDQTGGWKTFGGQGQVNSEWTSVPTGWKPTHWEGCGERYLMVTVVNKADTFTSSNSKIILDIGISSLTDNAKYFSTVISSLIVLSLSAVMY